MSDVPAPIPSPAARLTVSIVMDAATGAMNIQHPQDLDLALTILGRAERVLLARFVEERAKASVGPKVEAAGSALLSALPKPNANGAANRLPR